VYLAQRRIEGKTRFFIRETYRDANGLHCRDLFDLGTDPREFVVYPGGNAFYIKEVVEDAIVSLNAKATQDDLETVFWPFIKPEIRRVIEPFQDRAKSRTHRRDRNPKSDAELRFGVHVFDKRRILFLRCGWAGMPGIEKIPPKLCLQFLEKSRDEIEQRFLTQERCLSPSELKTYLFATLDLQRFFPESFAKRLPEALDPRKIDKYFLEEICRLQQDRSFWAGEKTGETLHQYLIRYVIMFFDNDFDQGLLMGDYVKDFMNRQRFHWASHKHRMVSLDKASAVFGIKKETLKTMTKKGLTRIYRRMAQKLHPDKGGTQEEFVRLTEAYQELLRRKGASVKPQS
jgi:hypothetical protein